MYTNGEIQVVIFGLGYVGCVSAACLAELGHRVIGVDPDEHKVQSILNGHSPFYEPGLEELVGTNVAAGRLSASRAIDGALADADIALICVGTPSERNGNVSLEQLCRVFVDIARHLRTRSKPLTVAVRSTVLPGTCERLWRETLGNGGCISVVSNPEFLREGQAIRDFMKPSLLVVGGADPAAVKTVADLYAPLGVEACLVSLRAAEMIKYACNAFHAVKITFANEIGVLSELLGAEADEVMQTLCRDVKLNISPAYLRPGFAFGGSCLPKDLRALIYQVGQMDLQMPFLGSVIPSNEEHLWRAIEAVEDLTAERIGIFGLAFKENTDDLRESPAVTLIEHLLGKGRHLRVFDPNIQLGAIYGSNRNFVLSAVPHIEHLLVPCLDDVLRWAQHLVITLKPSLQCAQAIESSGIPALNLTDHNWIGYSQPRVHALSEAFV